MTASNDLPSLEGLEVTEVYTTYRFRDGGEIGRIPSKPGARRSWSLNLQGVASARRWATTWTTGVDTPPQGVSATWAPYSLKSSFDSGRTGKQSVIVTAIFKGPGRRVRVDLRYRAGAFEGGTWSEEIGREPRTTGELTVEPEDWRPDQTVAT